MKATKSSKKMSTGKRMYKRVHTNNTAFEKHVIGLKKRGAKMKVDGMTITYSFPD